MARAAQRINLGFLMNHELAAIRPVYGVAIRAGHFILGVPPGDTSYRSVHSEVAGEADLVCLRRLQFGRLADIVRRSRFGVLRSRAVARLTTLFGPAPVRIVFDYKMRRLRELIEDLLVAGFAGFRACKARGIGRSRGRQEACRPSEEDGARNRVAKVTRHALC